MLTGERDGCGRAAATGQARAGARLYRRFASASQGKRGGRAARCFHEATSPAAAGTAARAAGQRGRGGLSPQPYRRSKVMCLDRRVNSRGNRILLFRIQTCMEHLA
jgi:hypothetical protein